LDSTRLVMLATMEESTFQIDGTIWVNDALWWPSWHKELITFLPSQNLFHKFGIATVMEQAKQKHVDHSAHTMSLAIWYCTEAFSLNIGMLNIFLLSNVFPIGGCLADSDVAVMYYMLTQDIG